MIQKLRFCSFIILAFIGLGLLPGCNRIEEPLRIESGLLSGISGADSSIRAYLGVPFAAPPVGDLRWREPQPAEPWQGVRSADKLPPACIQNLAKMRLPWTEEFMLQGEMSEDCLYLNVWTGANTAEEKRPVMVYIYVGFHRSQSGRSSVLLLDQLCRNRRPQWYGSASLVEFPGIRQVHYETGGPNGHDTDCGAGKDRLLDRGSGGTGKDNPLYSLRSADE